MIWITESQYGTDSLAVESLLHGAGVMLNIGPASGHGRRLCGLSPTEARRLAYAVLLLPAEAEDRKAREAGREEAQEMKERLRQHPPQGPAEPPTGGEGGR